MEREPKQSWDEWPVNAGDSTTDDPRQRVSRLRAANRRPIKVGPSDTLARAVTIMLTNDFSQLPVMSGDREVKGVVSWQSIAKRQIRGETGQGVRHFMDLPHLVSHDTPLLTAMREVAAHDYVLVRGEDRGICGIVTTSDISAQAMRLTEPFLLLGEIERCLRALLKDLPAATLQGVCDPADSTRTVNGVDDLTFGEYVRLLENPQTWAELHIQLDRSEFVKFLDHVRVTRNHVMHFDPAAVSEEAVQRLRNLVKVLDWLRA